MTIHLATIQSYGGVEQLFKAITSVLTGKPDQVYDYCQASCSQDGHMAVMVAMNLPADSDSATREGRLKSEKFHPA